MNNHKSRDGKTYITAAPMHNELFMMQLRGFNDKMSEKSFSREYETASRGLQLNYERGRRNAVLLKSFTDEQVTWHDHEMFDVVVKRHVKPNDLLKFIALYKTESSENITPPN